MIARAPHKHTMATITHLVHCVKSKVNGGPKVFGDVLEARFPLLLAQVPATRSTQYRTHRPSTAISPEAQRLYVSIAIRRGSLLSRLIFESSLPTRCDGFDMPQSLSLSIQESRIEP